MDADQERRKIRAAMDRLLTGRPLRTAGALTIVGLAQEANVKRHVLTHRHTDLKDEFNARVRAQHHVPPQLAAANDQNTALQRRLDTALDDNRMLREQVHALARQLNLLVAEIDTTQRRGSTGRTLTKLP
jgi:hypothetical protein